MNKVVLAKSNDTERMFYILDFKYDYIPETRTGALTFTSTKQQHSKMLLDADTSVEYIIGGKCYKTIPSDIFNGLDYEDLMTVIVQVFPIDD